MTVLLKKNCLLFVLLFTSIFSGYSEGTRELEPSTQTGYVTKFQIGNDRVTNIATFSSPPDKRLYIHIGNPSNEKIYIGFGQLFTENEKTDIGNVTCYFRVKNSNGTIIYPATGNSTLVPTTGNGFINSRAEAIAGPNGLNGGGAGYQPIVIDPTAGVSGDYWIEFSRNSTLNDSSRVRFDLIDITVGDQSTLNQIKGRLWSKVWSLVTLSGANRSETSFYTYSPDSVVTKFNLNGMQPYGFAVMCNERGTNTSTNFLQSRRSVLTMNAGDGVNRAYPQYKIFLNDPDPFQYPSFITQLFLKSAFYNGCDTRQTCKGITVEVTKAANAEILLDLNGIPGFQPNTRDVFIATKLLGGINCVPWDGKDGLGVKINSNEKVSMAAKLSNGLTNFPIFDPENNTFGLIVQSVRPLNPGQIIPVFWDDLGVNRPGATANLNGCTAVPPNGCHIWSGGFGDNVTMNSWWYGSEFNTTTQLLIDPYPLANAYAGDDKLVCSRTANNISLGAPSTNPLYEYLWQPIGTKANLTALASTNLSQTTLNLNQLSGLNGTDTIQYEILVDNFGCLARDTVSIMVKEVGNVQIFGKSSVCPNSKGVTYWINKQNGLSNVNWTLSPSITRNPLNPVTTDTVYIDFLSSSATLTVQLTYTDPTCPQPTNVKPINIEATPKADPPFGRNRLCIKTERIQQYNVTPIANSTYDWSVETGRGTVQQNPNNPSVATVTWNNSITNTPSKVWVKQQYTLPDGTLCSIDSAALNVVGLDPIIGNPMPDLRVCNAEVLNLSFPEFSSNPTAARYIWQPTNGFITSTDIYNPQIRLRTLNNDTIDYNITVIKDGCFHRDTFRVAINPDARIKSIEGPNPACINSTAVYNVVDTFSTSRTWWVRDTVPQPYSSVGNANTSVKWGKFSNNAYVAVESISMYGCKPARDTLQIDKIFFRNFKPKYDSVICKSPTFAWGFKAGGDNGGNIYDWKFEKSDLSPTSPPTKVTSKGDTINATFSSTGLFFLSLKQSGADFGDNCFYYPDTLKINVFDIAVIEASDDTTICLKDTASLYVKQNQSFPFKWYAADAINNVTTTNLYKISPSPAGRTFKYYVELADENCKAKDSVNVTVNPLPPPPLNKKQLEFCFEDQALLSLSGPTNMTQYLWMPTNESSDKIDIAYSIFTDNLQEKYVSLRVQDLNGCFNKDSILIKSICDPRLFVPKAFSPNDDGYNDSLNVFGAHFKNFQIRVYNRWGEIIFETKDKTKFWDGTYRGGLVEPGVYPWVLTYESLRERDPKNPREEKGSITITK